MAYTALFDFMGGWFHQDFDIEGDSVPEIVRAFRGVTPLGEQKNLKSDIERFLAEHPDNLDGAFEEALKPDVIPSVLSGSTRAFLEEIRELLDGSAE